MQDDLEARFRRSYWSVVHRLDALRLRAWEQRGLTLPQLRVLFLLRSVPGMTTGAIADQLGVTTPTISGLVDKLVRAGLVERGHDAHDRRTIPLRLTEEGESVTGEFRQTNRAYIRNLAGILGDDLEAVTDALERLDAAAHTAAQQQQPEAHR